MTREESTKDLRREQAQREATEEQLIEEAAQPEEAEQHERRRDKAAYLAEKLAERERAERGG